jgi:hypothetical protein
MLVWRFQLEAKAGTDWSEYSKSPRGRRARFVECARWAGELLEVCLGFWREAAGGEALEKNVQDQTGVNYNPRSFTGSGRTRSILRFSAPIRVL